jgi:glycosyltransferase involved in cell wall biosynthesis
MAGRGEGFGIVFLEAMACGVPVVGSKLDGSRDALRDGRLGILVDPDNHAELAAGIGEALVMPKGVPQGLEYFHYDRFAERVQTLLATIGRPPV